MANTTTRARGRGSKRSSRKRSAARKQKGWLPSPKAAKAAAKHTAYYAREGRWVYTWVRNRSGVVVAEGKWAEKAEIPATITPEIVGDQELSQHVGVVATVDAVNLGLLRAKTAAALEVMVQLYALWQRKATFGSAAKKVAWSAVVAGSDGLFKAGLSFCADAAAKALWGTSTFSVAGHAIGGAPAAAGVFLAESCYEVAKLVTGHTTKKAAAKAIGKNGARLGLTWGGAEVGATIGLAAGPVGGVVGAVVGGLVGFGAFKLGEWFFS